MSFGALQRAFSKRCVRLMIEGKESVAKTDLEEFIYYIKSKKPLLQQFCIYEALHNHFEDDKDLAIQFIKETLKQLDVSRGDVLTFNTLLKNKFNLTEDSSELDSAISLLIESTVSTFNYDVSKTASAFKKVLSHVMTDRETPQPIEELTKKYNQFGDAGLEFYTPQRVVRLAVKKFNNEFGPLFSEAERSLFKRLQSANSKESLAELYNGEYSKLIQESELFISENKDLDDDIIRNISLAKENLKQTVSIKNLLNIVELRNQIKELI